MRKIKRDTVACLIFSKDGKLFQGMKDPTGGGVYADCWHIPGGGIEVGESKIQAVIREVREETGIDIRPYSIELVDDSGHGESEKILKDSGEKVIAEMTFNVYKVVVTDKTADQIKVKLSDDLVKCQWTEISNLSFLKLTPPSIELFTKLGYLDENDYRKNFHTL